MLRLKRTILLRFLNLTYSIGLVFLFIFIPLRCFSADTSDNELDCFIEPSLVTNVGSEVAGIIDTIKVDRNDIVNKGDVLAHLDSRVEEATMNLIQARLDYATREYNRKNDLYKKSIIPINDIDEAETSMVVTQRELKQAQEALERRTIRSPITGVVVERFLSPGERVDNQPILKLSQLNPLYVEVIAPLGWLGSVKIGKKVEVRPENPIDGAYIGRVKIVDRVIDGKSGTFGIRIELPNPKYSIPAGVKCQVRFL